MATAPQANTDRARAIDLSHGTRGEEALSTLKTLQDAKSSVGPTQKTSIFDLFDKVLGGKTGTTTQGGTAAIASQQTEASASDALLKAASGGSNA